MSSINIFTWTIAFLLLLVFLKHGYACPPGLNFQRKRIRKPFQFKQHEPKFEETSAQASGESKRVKRGTAAYDELIINVNPNIVFRDDRGTGDNRRMTKRCESKLQLLASKVKDHWGGKVKLRVIRGYDSGESAHRHPKRYPFPNLHYAGRAVDITTSDVDRKKNPMLARLAYEAGFDWVAYGSKGFVHASVQSEEESTSQKSGCFHSNSTVFTQNRAKVKMKDLKIGDKVASMDHSGKIVFSPIIMFFHQSPKLRTSFRIIKTENHQKVAITPSHFIYKLNKHTQRDVVDYAKGLTAGDKIYVRNPLDPYGPLTTERVIEISEEDMLGAFAPLTETGTLIVDDILVSCYAVFPSDAISHWSMLPVRLMAWFYPSFFDTKEEMHWYPRSLLRLYNMAQMLSMREV